MNNDKEISTNNCNPSRKYLLNRRNYKSIL